MNTILLKLFLFWFTCNDAHNHIYYESHRPLLRPEDKTFVIMIMEGKVAILSLHLHIWHTIILLHLPLDVKNPQKINLRDLVIEEWGSNN